MITLEDCLAFCGLSREEVEAIAEHEHIPHVTAAAMAQYLLQCPGGKLRVRDLIRDDIATARRHGRRAHAHELSTVLRRFLECHPEARKVPLREQRLSHLP